MHTTRLCLCLSLVCAASNNFWGILGWCIHICVYIVATNYLLLLGVFIDVYMIIFWLFSHHQLMRSLCTTISIQRIVFSSFPFFYFLNMLCINVGLRLNLMAKSCVCFYYFKLRQHTHARTHTYTTHTHTNMHLPFTLTCALDFGLKYRYMHY